MAVATIYDLPSVSWIVIGDFNEILFSFEKQKGQLRSERQMRAFTDVLDECELVDLSFDGVWYTWERGRSKSNNIRE